MLVVGAFQNNIKGHDTPEIHFSDPCTIGHFLRLTFYQTEIVNVQEQSSIMSAHHVQSKIKFHSTFFF